MYIFTLSGTALSAQAYIKAPNAQAEDRFGHSLAIHKDTLAVGAELEDGCDWGVAFGIENRSDFVLSITLDCSGSTNVISHRGSLSAEVKISPGSFEIVHHLVPPARPILVSSWPRDPLKGTETDAYTNANTVWKYPEKHSEGMPEGFGHDMVLSGVVDQNLGIRRIQ